MPSLSRREFSALGAGTAHMLQDMDARDIGVLKHAAFGRLCTGMTIQRQPIPFWTPLVHDEAAFTAELPVVEK